MIDLKTKQAFWVEQLPIFKEKYWLPDHLEVLKFDMIGGCFEIAKGITTDFSEEDLSDIYHRVNSGWAMWKKAVSFMKDEAQAVPEGYVLVTEDQAKDTARLDFMLDDSIKRTVCHQKHWSDDGDLIKEGQCVAEIYYISGWDYIYESISETKRKAIDKAIFESELGAEG
ncbi:hypothetical protein MER72_06055 [Acinetobacter baumannii]|nr:hypothetical protein [Acinetobacter baumannii]